jgi:sugar/nucleoside kinase (ribokinase family)
MVLISPDHERTFATHLGAAVELDAADLAEEMFADCAVFHVEGYLVQNHALLETAFRLARKANCTVSLDLASHNTVDDNLEFLRRMTQEYVDVVFANEDEARVFTGETDPRRAVEVLNRSAELAVVKVGPEGSLVRKGSEQIQVDAVSARVVDTTGAGDLYAAGFLYALLKNHDLKTCARIGSLLGSRVVEVVGAKMGPNKWAGIQREVAQIETGRA